MPTIDPSFRYVSLIRASVFLLPWTALFVARPALRRPMLWASALTAPFRLTELLFVHAHWNPPSLFDRAHRTGFDIERFIFCFAGLAVAGYRLVAPWYIISADNKWFTRGCRRRNFEKLKSLKLSYPSVSDEHWQHLLEARALLAE